MNAHKFVALALAGLALGACHSRNSATLNGLTPVSDLNAPPPSMKFSGRFSPVLQTASGQAMTTGAIRITGTVRVLGQPGSDERFTVETEFTTERGAEELLWSIVEGTCGNPALPLVSPHLLPPIDVPSGGRIHATMEFRSTLNASGTYHLNLYANQGVRLADVVGCANLKGA